jgi:hypothetical protein
MLELTFYCGRITMKKRSSYLQFHQEFDLDRAGITVSGYDKRENFVCRLEINHSGVALYTGSTGRKRVADVPCVIVVPIVV